MTILTTLTQYLALSTGENIFYREAGAPTSPTILLLHGFPSSSHQYRKLIPVLAPHYHVLSPDLPAYGFTTVPENYTYTFDNIADTIDTFLAELPNSPKNYSIYVFDYGAPTGFRLALKHPEKVQAIVSQNGNAYTEGLGAFWDPIKAIWASNNSASARDVIRPFLELNGTKSQYFNGTPTSHISSIAPESYTLDQALMDRPGNKETQLDLLYDYRTNVDLYPRWQEWFRKSQIPLLAIWGGNDAIFVKEGAEAFKRDLPKAEVRLLDAGHFAVETNAYEIGKAMVSFLGRNGI
ncbi:putative hydrolase or acyltransferase of alpha/beta superfamily [Byssothecium circinans]|uniref:Putative hydrolase or acyltransferase of alpha/beta superfamily n=1 Tax=Byssothecium circinans TaxID=147558 RepID=A0A6A5U362_9PLEO|nr:putative hydrolase or acyltransferase of alpha/beta superfamily [Byssothecium circinans]